MDGDDCLFAEVGFEDLAAVAKNADVASKQRFRRGAAEGDENPRLKRIQFGVKPRAACSDVSGARRFMNATLAAWLPFEMLHGIRDVDFFSINAGFLERTVEKLASRPDKRPTFAVLGIARLFPDEDDLRARRAFSEDGLRGILV